MNLAIYRSYYLKPRKERQEIQEEIGGPYIDNKNVHRHAKVAAVCVTSDGHRSAAFSLLVIVQDRELHTVFLRQSVPIVENGRHHAGKRVGLLRRNVA